ncbi:hypothetical protein TIFTF001_044502 [Ficus carica]|uniref:Uncharacterized protein n=1 Tax=Ficus carica TaxID=3494 RepID=A0AA87Z5N4_FICCA|nr:hypothetical protein TIFTF001_044499 [Ficus carica]GMN30667.1 hypothetical protein TIFTF001_044502 [Ficus carica]
MMKMFRTDISKQVSAGSSPPTLVSDCVSRAIRAEYWINRDKKARAQIFKARKEEKAVVKQTQSRQSSESNQKGQTSGPAQNSKQFGRNKRNGNFSAACVQARLEGLSIAQGRLEAPEPQAKIFAYTRGDAEAGTSHVVTGQISITTHEVLPCLILVPPIRLYLWSSPRS